MTPIVTFPALPDVPRPSRRGFHFCAPIQRSTAADWREYDGQSNSADQFPVHQNGTGCSPLVERTEPKLPLCESIP
jgi:hypothetical protein